MQADRRRATVKNMLWIQRFDRLHAKPDEVRRENKTEHRAMERRMEERISERIDGLEARK